MFPKQNLKTTLLKISQQMEGWLWLCS